MTTKIRWALVLAAALLCGAAAARPAGGPSAPPSSETARAAARAAATWLTHKQEKDGSFSGYPGAKVGTTALAVWALATSPAAYREADGPYISDAVKFLLANQRADGSFALKGEPGLECYNTSLAILALAALEKPLYRKSLERARDYLLKLQNTEARGYNEKDHVNSYGGVGYGEDNRGDLSNTGLALEAMGVLRDSGIQVPQEFFTKVLIFVRRCSNDPEISGLTSAAVIGDHGGKYAPGAGKAGEETDREGVTGWRSYGSMTYSMVKSYIYAGLKPDSPEVRSAFVWISNNYSLDENPGMAAQGLYYYYLMLAKALALNGQAEFTAADQQTHNWARELTQKLIELRQPDGYWVNENPRWGEADQLLCTCYTLRTLSLCCEELARQEAAAKAAPAKSSKSSAPAKAEPTRPPAKAPAESK